jgi:hypothetical protein
LKELDALSDRFWAWRSSTQPRTRDDIPRLTRPIGWLPSVGVEAVTAQRRQSAAFESELALIRPSDVADAVDHRLLRSAMARVTWELDVANFWHQPRFYTDQALGPVFDVLLPLGVDAPRVREVARLLVNVPAVLSTAREILPDLAVAEFTAVASAELVGIEGRIEALARALSDIEPASEAILLEVSSAAATALGSYRDWLHALAPTLPAATPIGPERYEWFLREVACIPLTAERIRALARQELNRAVVLEMLARRRCRDIAKPELPPDGGTQARREKEQEQQVRDFLVSPTT